MTSVKSTSGVVVQPTSRYRNINVMFVMKTLVTLTLVSVVIWTTSSSSFLTVKTRMFVNFSETETVILNHSNSLYSVNSNHISKNRSEFDETNNGGILEYKNLTRVHNVVFKDMPDPCLKPRRNTGVEDLLCMKPLEFLQDYKNPCWMDGHVLRCMPYFQLFGICKSGTSDLFQRLYLHPDIIPNNGINQKETWFWSRFRYTTHKIGNSQVFRTIKDFSNNFKSNEIRKNVDSNGYHYRITGHGDPMDIWERFLDVKIPQNDPTSKEMLWTSAFLIRKVNPDVKLLLMLRDPVERLYSMYFHHNFGNSSDDFHQHVVKAIPLWKTCLKENTMRHCIYDKKLKRAIVVPLCSSFYSFHLKDWLKTFPREQILVMRNEDYKKDIKGTLKQIFTFLNVSMPNDNLMNKMESKKRFYVTAKKINAGPMKTETKQMLKEFYRESTQELADLLKDKHFAFEDVSFGRNQKN